MKQIIPLMALLFLTACATTPTGTVPNVPLIQATAKSTVFIGTTLYLKSIPEARGKFATARNGIKALISAGTFSASDLTAALQALPVKELKSDAGTLIIGEVVILWDVYGRRLTNLDKAQVFNTYILPVAQSILDGLDLALAGSP